MFAAALCHKVERKLDASRAKEKEAEEESESGERQQKKRWKMFQLLKSIVASRWALDEP